MSRAARRLTAGREANAHRAGRRMRAEAKYKRGLRIAVVGERVKDMI
jgi:hypothetical protein